MPLTGKTLHEATVVGPGTSVRPDTPKMTATMQVTVTGTGSALVQLEGSIDGVNWWQINAQSFEAGQHVLVSGVSTYVFAYIRGDIISITADCTVDASIAIFPGAAIAPS